MTMKQLVWLMHEIKHNVTSNWRRNAWRRTRYIFWAHLQWILLFKSIVMTEVTTLPGIYDFALESFGCQAVNCWNRVATILAGEAW